LIGRLLGFAREILLVETYGLTAKADTISLLLTWSETLAGFVLAGSSASWLIPKLLSARSNNELIATLLLFRTSVLAVSVVIGLIGFIFAEYIFRLLYVGGSFSESDIIYFRTISLAVIFISLFSVDNAYLQGKKFFLTTALSTPLLNLGIIFAIFLSAESGLLTIFLFLFTFYFLRWIFVSRFVLKSTLRDFSSYLKPIWGNKIFYKFLLCSSLAAFSSTSFPLVLKSLASLGGDGKYVAVGLALKFFEVPTYILISSINLVFASNYGSLADKNDKRSRLLASELVHTGLISTCVTCATLLLLDIVIQYDFINLIGRSVNYSEPILYFYYLIIALPFFSIFNSLVVHFFSIERPGIIIMVSLLSLLVSCILWYHLSAMSLNLEIVIGITHFSFFFLASLGLFVYSKKEICFKSIKPVCYLGMLVLMCFILSSLFFDMDVSVGLCGIVFSLVSFFIVLLNRRSLVIFL